jgi:chromosomal replication initiation ATPase DnaA
LNLGIEPDIIIEEVARRYKKNPEKLVNSKTRPAVEKQIAIYLIRRYTGLTNGEIGKIRNQVKKLISIFQG